MIYWHIQMNQPWGRDSGTIDSKLMLQESPAVIGTGEWDHFQCRNFKNEDGTGLAIGDIILVREASRPIALCKVSSNYYDDEELEEEYINKWYRNVEILEWYKGQESFPQPQGTLQKLSDESSASWKFIDKWLKKIKSSMETNKITEILKLKKQIILQGAPGTGKTYTTAAVALSILGVDYDSTNHAEIMRKYKELVNKQIFFTTFHQSMDYEDFVEGLKPEVVDGGGIVYRVENGVFKLVCQEAENDLKEEGQTNFETKLDDLEKKCIGLQDSGKFLELKTREGAKFYLKYELGNDKNFFVQPLNSVVDNPKYYLSVQNIKSYYAQKDNSLTYISYIIPVVEYLNLNPVEEKQGQNYVLIIDEINRGNISKIFGELITLLESDKRKDGDHPLNVILPYSKKPFEVPSNLFIIGTMNTTDRSVGHIDYAVRRRFAFFTLKSSKEAIESFYNRIGEGDLKVKALELFEGISHYIKAKKSPELDLEDLMVGHSYFMSKSIDELKLKLEYEIIPLLKEYEKDGLITLKETERTELGQDWKIILS